MAKKLKNWLSGRFPNLAGAYHAFRISEEMRKHPVRTTPFGFRFMGHERMQRGEFEPAETQLFQKLAPEVDVFVDVGANIGYYVCLMRSLGKHVVAVEPMRKNLDYLLGNLSANDWNDVEVMPVGLAAQPSIQEIYGGGTGASLIPNWAGASGTLRSTIPINTLDNILGTRFSGRQLLIKVDVEGAELDVLRGAMKILQMTPAPLWQIEVCLTEHHAFGLNPDFLKLFEYMFDLGYVVFSVEGDMREVMREDARRWFEQKRRDFGYANFFFRKAAGNSPA